MVYIVITYYDLYKNLVIKDSDTYLEFPKKNLNAYIADALGLKPKSMDKYEVISLWTKISYIFLPRKKNSKIRN